MQENKCKIYFSVSCTLRLFLVAMRNSHSLSKDSNSPNTKIFKTAGQGLDV